MYTTASRRLNEPAPTFYPVSELVAAINEGQRLFVFLTLCLETTLAWNAAPQSSPFYSLLTVFPDLIAPLRLMDGAGGKIRCSRLEDLTSLDAAWPATPGTPKRYARIGADLVALYPQPVSTALIQVTYARAPLALAADTDVPEIPASFHNELVNYAINRVRQVEGAAELEKTMPLLNSFLDAVQTCGEYVRARNRGNQYDIVPFEMSAFDRSQLLKVRKDLVPMRTALAAVE